MRSVTSIVYAYGVLTNCSDLVLDIPTGGLSGLVESGPLRILPFGDIGALVCDFILPNGSDLEAILEDSRSAERMIVNHHLVLADMVSRCTILPLRFGAVFAEDAGVIAALDGSYSALQIALGRIDGAIEWGVKSFCNRSMMSAYVAENISEIRDLEISVADHGDGKAFFQKRRIQRLTSEEVEKTIEQCLVGAQKKLKPHALEEALVKLQPRTVHGHKHEMVSNRSYLVARGMEDAFMEKFDDLRVAYAPFGFDYQINGPWPAYSFSDQQLGAGVYDK
jgi:hypothetical protein